MLVRFPSRRSTCMSHKLLVVRVRTFGWNSWTFDLSARMPVCDSRTFLSSGSVSKQNLWTKKRTWIYSRTLQADHLKFQIVSDGSDDLFQMMVKIFQTIARRGMTRMSEASLYLIISDIWNFRPECTFFQILSRWFIRSPDFFQIACSDSRTRWFASDASDIWNFIWYSRGFEEERRGVVGSSQLV